jgi:hypothetical protein
MQEHCADRRRLCCYKNTVLIQEVCAVTRKLCWYKNTVLLQEHCADTRTLCWYKNTVLIPKHSLLLNVRTLCVTRINFIHVFRSSQRCSSVSLLLGYDCHWTVDSRRSEGIFRVETSIMNIGNQMSVDHSLTSLNNEYLNCRVSKTWNPADVSLSAIEWCWIFVDSDLTLLLGRGRWGKHLLRGFLWISKDNYAIDI